MEFPVYVGNEIRGHNLSEADNKTVFRCVGGYSPAKDLWERVEKAKYRTMQFAMGCPDWNKSVYLLADRNVILEKIPTLYKNLVPQSIKQRTVVDLLFKISDVTTQANIGDALKESGEKRLNELIQMNDDMY